jgi:hypothetical protein
MDLSGTVVIIKAGDCGHCIKNLSPKLPEIESKLKARGLKVKIFSVPLMQSPINGIYPDCIGKAEWFPFTFYVDNSTWRDIERGAAKRENFNVLNGSYNKNLNKFEIVNQGYNPFSADHLIKWVKQINDNARVSKATITNNKPKEYRLVKSENEESKNDFGNITLVPRRKYGRKIKR